MNAYIRKTIICNMRINPIISKNDLIMDENLFYTNNLI